MGRRNRYDLPGFTYHVILRGNDGQAIFFNDEDRSKFCLLIQEGVERFGHKIHAFCFMTNHIHFAIEMAEVSISKIIQNLAFRYARYINRKYERIGHLFQGRFKSIIVDSERYLKELVRYIHLNPVRAGLVDTPEKYPWSSYRAYIGDCKIEYTWLTFKPLLTTFGDTYEEAICNFHQYVINGVKCEEVLNFESGEFEGIVGEDNFIDEVQISKESSIESTSLPKLVERVCLQYNIDKESLRCQGKVRKASYIRNLLAYIVRENPNLKLVELSKLVDRDPSSLSKQAGRFETKLSRSKALRKEVDQILAQMSECQA